MKIIQTIPCQPNCRVAFHQDGRVEFEPCPFLALVEEPEYPGRPELFRRVVPFLYFLDEGFAPADEVYNFLGFVPENATKGFLDSLTTMAMEKNEEEKEK